jgi:hypothetical protein
MPLFFSRLSPCTEAAHPVLSEDSREITKIVFEHLFARYLKDTTEPRNTYCLSVESGKDPDEALLRDLTVQGVKMIGASGCAANHSENQETRYLVVDTEAGKPAVSFFVGEVQPTGDSKTQVKAGYETSVLSGYTFLYSLQKKNGKWQVTGTKRLNVA